MLIESPRITRRDMDVWRSRERQDAVWARLPSLARKADAALSVLREFAEAGPCWVGTSWGKDSVIVAHLAATLHAEGCPAIPVVWFRAFPVGNPECSHVRDAFLATHRVAYEEVPCDIPLLSSGEWGIDEGYDPIWRAYHRRHPRHVLGLRAQESPVRALRMRTFGTTTKNTCAPIGRWSAKDVFGYLHKHALPVHPTYAMSQGRAWDRERLRVAALGGTPGRGHGRAQWEEHYYGDVLLNARRGGG